MKRFRIHAIGQWVSQRGELVHRPPLVVCVEVDGSTGIPGGMNQAVMLLSEEFQEFESYSVTTTIERI